MNHRDNLLNLYRRRGCEAAPVGSQLCPDLERRFQDRYPGATDYRQQFQFPLRLITDPGFPWIAEIPGFVPERRWDYDLYYDPPIAPGARLDIWGIAHEPGGPECKHMTHMRHPLERLDSLEQFQAYPWPAFDKADWSFLGMQSTIMMSASMYRTWLKPRLKRVIEAAKTSKPDILIQYHSCGYVTPLVPDFIEAGIDILNPVQPECMDVEQVLGEFRGQISFNGTLGTQTTMPFGTPAEVRATVRRHLRLAGPRGGLFCCPTHMLEPEVPWENVEAYVAACREWEP